MPAPSLLLACGALGREVIAVLEAGGVGGLEVTCLPANLHNKPQLIAEAVRDKVRKHRDEYDNIFVLYADCGTGGDLDKVCDEEGVVRIPGAHCYEFYAGASAFEQMADAEPATFYLTNYLTRHFETLIMVGLGLDRFPELLPDYFGNYSRVVYLAQTDDPELDEQARKAAEKLGLAYERRFTGYGELADFIVQAAQTEPRKSLAS